MHGLYFQANRGQIANNGSRPGSWALYTSFVHEDNIYTAQRRLNANTDLSADQVAQTDEYISYLDAMNRYTQNLVELPRPDILELVYADRYD